MKDELDPFDKLTKTNALMVIAIVSPVYVLYAFLGDYGRARAGALAAFALTTVIMMTWRFFKTLWYPVVILALLAVHTVLIVYVPWSDASYPGWTLLPLVLVDLFACYGVVRLAEKMCSIIWHK